MTLRVNVILITLIFASCEGGNRGNTPCATKLTYTTNRFISGQDALREAAVYRANIDLGSRDLTVPVIIDTASANLVVNEKSYDFSEDTVLGQKHYLFDNGHLRSIATNAKDSLDIACLADFSTRFSLTVKEQATPNYLGLAYRDPIRHPHEGKSVSFFDQLVTRERFDNVFSLALCGLRGNSRLLLGGVDDRISRFIGNFVPIIEKTAYVVPALILRRADNKKVLGAFPIYNPKEKSGQRTIIDSSQAFLMLPSAMAIAVADEIQNEAKALGLLDYFPSGFFRTERFNSIKVAKFLSLSQMKQLPSLEITFLGADGKQKALELSPLHYFKEIDPSDPLVRTFAIREASQDIILGQPFLENHYTFFDRQNGRIGFANIDLACAN